MRGRVTAAYVNIANAGTTRLTSARYVLSSPAGLPVALEACDGTWDEVAHTCDGAIVEVARTDEQQPETRVLSGEVPHTAGSVARLRLRPLHRGAAPGRAVVTLSVEVWSPTVDS